MARDVFWHALAEVPWAELTRLVVTIALCWLTWLLTKLWYAREWLRFAPEKARDQLVAQSRALERERRKVMRLQGECAKLRGQVAAARERLEEPMQLELVEGVQR